jgi:glycosyltransferase involved in cell wall biosynthesis
MEDLIDVVGYFGTTYSYATVASWVARDLLKRGRLGNVYNLDDEWHGAHCDLSDRQSPGKRVVCFVAPNHYIDVFALRYGRKNTALFMSPNTDRLAAEHAMTCGLFGAAFTPSSWCSETVRRDVPDCPVYQQHLGVDPRLIATREQRIDHLKNRLKLRVPKLVHFTSDQFLPGRKGTSELLLAWAALKSGPVHHHSIAFARLIIHASPALHEPLLREARDLDIDTSVEIRGGAYRGGGDDLLALFDEADLVVAPSRCEGFGIMLLSTLAAGVPLLCTYTTGQVDFLGQLPGWLGVPCGAPAMLAGEEGLAPTIEPVALMSALLVGTLPQARQELILQNWDASSARAGVDWSSWSWDVAASRWGDLVLEWAKGD